MLTLNYRDTRPIYEQIYDGLRRLMISGAIAPEDKLPSVRELAAELAINPNTIQRAYRELEQAGYIYIVTGRGAYCAGLEQAASERRAELLSRLEELARELRLLGVEESQAAAHLHAVWQAEQEESK